METIVKWRWLQWLWLLFALMSLLIMASEGAPHAYSASLATKHALPVPQQSQPTPTPAAHLTDTQAIQPAIVRDASPAFASAGEMPYVPTEQRVSFQPSPAQSYNLIVNGSFEEGFVEGVAAGWQHFATADVIASWHDDTWQPVLYDGSHAQLLALKDASERDRYVGIFQTVPVVPNAEYVLTLHGLVRSDEGSVETSSYGYRLQYGLDYTGGSDWRSSQIDWIELPWDEQPRTTPPPGGYHIETYTATIKAQGPRLTLFIRGWKKWIGAAEGNYDVDGISLVPAQAAASASIPAPQGALPTPLPQMPQTGDSAEQAVMESRLMLASVVMVILLLAGVLWRSRQHYA